MPQVELQESQHSHSEPGLVSLVVKDDKERCACGPAQRAHHSMVHARPDLRACRH
jgi:hypothetical protein